MAFYDNLTRICRERGMSVNSMIVQMGMSKSNHKAWREGAVPHEATLLKIARFLNVSANDLTSEAKKATPVAEAKAQQPIQSAVGKQEEVLLKMYSMLGSDLQDELLAYAHSLVQKEMQRLNEIMGGYAEETKIG